MRKFSLLFLAFVASMGTVLAIEGALTGRFTINAEGDQIFFSKGNLQATYNSDSWSWAFAANQCDYIGNVAANNAISGNGSVASNGTVDLFGWSTVATYYGIHNSTDYRTYLASGEFFDWGTNIIHNGGNEANLWRTLTINEWGYLFTGRANAAKLFGMGSVNGINGTILLPDNWTGDKYTDAEDGLVKQGSYYYNENGSSYSFHNYTEEQWKTMEDNGAVFLPAAGVRDGANVNNVGMSGGYWSASPLGGYYAGSFFFNAYSFYPQKYNDKCSTGFCVRLVQSAPGVPSDFDQITNQQSKINNKKLIKDGQLYIQRGNELFNAQGARVR